MTTEMLVVKPNLRRPMVLLNYSYVVGVRFRFWEYLRMKPKHQNAASCTYILETEAVLSKAVPTVFSRWTKDGSSSVYRYKKTRTRS